MFKLKSIIIFILLMFIYQVITSTPKYDPKKNSDLAKKQLEEINNDPIKKAKFEEEQRERDMVIKARIATATNELELLYPNVKFDVTNYNISAEIPISLNYKYDNIKKLAKDIAIIGAKNSLITKHWSYEYGCSKNICIINNHYLKNGTPVTDITEYESGRYWNNNGFYSRIIKKRVEKDK